MGKFLASFAGINPLHMAIAAGAIFLAGLAIGTGAGWTLNGWRLSGNIAALEGEVKTQTLGLNMCGDKIKTQNDAVAGWKEAATQAKGKGDTARVAADRVVKGLQPELERLGNKVAEKAAAGAARSCGDGVAEVRKGLRP